MCFISQSGEGGRGAQTGAPRPSPFTAHTQSKNRSPSEGGETYIYSLVIEYLGEASGRGRVLIVKKINVMSVNKTHPPPQNVRTTQIETKQTT